MRKTIDEVKYGNKESYYIITLTDDDGKVINKETIKYSVRQTQINDSEYLILYDEQMNVIEPTYKYINHKMKYKSLETKTKSMQALKDLYEFSRFIEKQINEFDINDFIKLQYFIQGNTNLTSIDFIHMYQSKEIYVVGRYMGIIRDYLKYCRYKNANCIESVVKTMFEKKMIKRNYSCPKYISINDMKKILDYLENDTKLSSETKLKYECIFRLMYEAGLRIGEVLGLSLEDFELRKRKLDGLPVGIITIRNRLSDSRIQNAKTCMNIFDKKQYELGSYKTFGSGFQTITVSESLYNDIMDYFDMYCVKLQKNKKRPAIADTVTDEFKESNYYIFNNETVNTPLRKKTLEKYTRDMFEYLDIPIDTEKRFNNLFHRFRHGFIMNLLYEKNLPPSEVIKYSRHTSTRSLEPYNNPTDEELTKHLENIETDYEEFDWEGEDDE